MRIRTWNKNWDPFAELQRQMNRLINFTFGDRGYYSGSGRQPACNLYELENEFRIITPVPGMKAEDFEITTNGNALILKGKRKRPESVDGDNFRREERWYGEWARNFTIPQKADIEKISATLENGLLIVHIPKVPQSMPRNVPIQIGSETHA